MPGQRGDQAVERRGLLEQVAGELALELDGLLGPRLGRSARRARPSRSSSVAATTTAPMTELTPALRGGRKRMRDPAGIERARSRGVA